MGTENTTDNWAGSGIGATGGTDAGNRASVDSTQPLRTTQGTSSSGDTGAQSDDIVAQAKEGAGQVMGQVQETAGGVVEQVRQQATSRLSDGKDRASDTLGHVAQAIRDTGTTLREKDQPEIANYANSAASQVERLSSFLQNRDVDDLIIEVQRFARRQPGVFLGGAFALGLLGARFLKSSGRAAQGSQGSQWDSANMGSAYGTGYGTGSGSYGYGGSQSGYAGSAGAGRLGAGGVSSASGSLGAGSGSGVGAAGEWTGGSSTGYAGGIDDVAGDVTASDNLAAEGTSGFAPYTPSSEA